MEFSYDNLKNILISEDFSKLKDQFENELIDVKEYPYRLETEHGKEELCKDVSSMLNNTGGFILLGVKGKEDSNHRFEKIDSVVGIKTSLNEVQYIQCLKNGMYPEEPLISFRECTLDKRKVFYIEIPQKSVNKPFFIFKKNSSDIQYWQRTGSHGVQLEKNRLHEISKKGLEYEKYLMNIGKNIEELVKQLKSTTRQQPLGELKKQL